jgi:hypothetical protein
LQTGCAWRNGDRDDEVLVDFAVDSPPHLPPTMTVLGPTLAPRELAGRKLLALFGRAEARDFADVYVLAERFGEDGLLREARAVDPGFDEQVLAQMMKTLDRFSTTRSRLQLKLCLRYGCSSPVGPEAVVTDSDKPAEHYVDRGSISTALVRNR